VSARVFRALLRLYPSATRARFGDGLVYAWQRDLEAARVHGPAARLAFWTRTVWDACRFAAAGRAGSLHPRGMFAVDWRDAWRALRSAPLVTLFCITSLALGIGGVTALFAILNGLVLKPLPVRDPQRLVILDDGSWTNPIWEAIRDRQQGVVEDAFAWATTAFNLAPSGAADSVRGLYVSGSFFDGLGVPAARGRMLGPRDDVRGGDPAGPAAVISYGFWQSRYQGAADVVGRTITIERVPFTIVGVTPERFLGPDVGRAYDVAVPLGAVPLIRPGRNTLDDRLSWWMNIMARLEPGQTAEEASARLRALQPQIRAATLPAVGAAEDLKQYLADPLTLVAAPGGRSPLRTRYQQPLTAILGVIGFVLVIACANIASLLIARASTRGREIAVRLALGASRARVARQLLAESALMALAGAAAGALVARWGSRLLLSQLTSYAVRIDLDLTPDWRLLAFATIVTGLVACVAGLAPALSASRFAAGDVLKDRPGGSSLRFSRARSVSVVVQVALSLALLVGAGLFVRTFARLAARDVGFERDGVLIVSADLDRTPLRGAARLAVVDRLAEAASAAPGVTSAAVSFTTPIGTAGWNTTIAVPGTTLSRRQRLSWVNAVTPGWFGTVGLRLSAGRDVTDADRAGAPPVAVVNRAFERRYLGGRDGVGQVFATEEPEGTRRFQVVGIVEDSVYRSLRSPMDPTMYMPIRQSDNVDWDPKVVARGPADVGAIARSVPQAIARAVPEAVLTIRTMREQVDASLTQERLLATLAAFFGGLALLLAAVGLYGLTAFTVASRRSEIGIRIALGASAQGIVRLVMRSVAVLVAAGLVLGTALAAWTAPLTRSLLFGLEPRDPVTFAGAAVVLVLIASVAAWLPARRAARLDPMTALRN
jgi:predicted permease